MNPKKPIRDPRRKDLPARKDLNSTGTSKTSPLTPNLQKNQRNFWKSPTLINTKKD